jgi:T-complex protein 1 subunit beta
MKVTNEGATILKSVVLDNPAANVLINMSKVQDEEVGDGTTSVTVLAGELLREAEKLINAKIHPQTIVAGFRQATEVAKTRLQEMAMDNSANQDQFRTDLINIAKTTLSSKVVQHDREFFAEMCVDAILRLDGSTNLDQIQIVKMSGGTLRESYLESGFILNKKIGVGQPKRIENARVMVANTAMDADKIKIFGARVRVNSIGEVAKLEAAEKAKMKTKCESIIASGLNVFINRQLIYNYPEQIFADAGVMAIEHADFDGVERLANCLDAEIASNFTDPAAITLGTCDLVEEIMIGEDRVLRFSGVSKGAACTMVLRGANGALLDEAERSVHDALCVLMTTVREHRSVYGGGACEIAMAQSVEAAAATVPGKASKAMKGFAVALRAIPHAVADNGGYDSAALIASMEAHHASGQASMGLDMISGTVGDMAELGIMESFRSKEQSLLSAAEAAEMIIRVDNIVKAAPRQRQ